MQRRDLMNGNAITEPSLAAADRSLHAAHTLTVPEQRAVPSPERRTMTTCTDVGTQTDAVTTGPREAYPQADPQPGGDIVRPPSSRTSSLTDPKALSPGLHHGDPEDDVLQTKTRRVSCVTSTAQDWKTAVTPWVDSAHKHDPVVSDDPRRISQAILGPAETSNVPPEIGAAALSAFPAARSDTPVIVCSPLHPCFVC